MKIICIGVFLYVCLISTVARPRSPKPVDNNKNEPQNRFSAGSYYGVLGSIYRCYNSSINCLGNSVTATEWFDCCFEHRALSYKQEKGGICFICPNICHRIHG